MGNKKVLVVGSGGRCHAIVDALSRSPQVGKIYCAPGNAGIAGQAECVKIGVEDVDALLEFATSAGIDLTVVGPEAALAVGIVDKFQQAGQRIFGPTKAAAEIDAKVLSNRKPPYSLAGGLFDAMEDAGGDMFKVTNDELRFWKKRFAELEGIDIHDAPAVAVASQQALQGHGIWPPPSQDGLLKKR